MLYKGSLHTWHSGGVAIKLKMGKSEDKSAEDTEEKVAASPISEEEKPETAEEAASKTDEKEDEKPAEDEKKDVESLRKVIKVDQTEEKKDEEPAEDDNKEEKPAEPVKEDKAPSDKGGSAGGNEAAETYPSSGRESLEQKRAILQNIKDFDFQIKKNQEELSSVNKKIGGMSKDLDDLVSLYEIVSEQMNPFVGLSKVTKKRLDALENFTREIDGLKERMGEMESFAERSGAKIQSLGQIKQKVDTIDADALIAQMDKGLKGGGEEEGKKTEGTEKSGENTSEEESKQAETATSEGEHAEDVSDEKDVDTEGSGETSKEEEGEDILHGEERSEEILPSTTTAEVPEDIFGNISTEETLQPMFVDLSPMDDDIFGESCDMDLNMIFETVFGALSASAEGKIDMIIDEFIESLKGQNVN